MESQWFYRWLQATWPWHVVGQFAVLFALGGLPALVWGGALRIVWVYHITWFVNSASHVWGNQTYNTGDLSRNNWCVVSFFETAKNEGERLLNLLYDAHVVMHLQVGRHPGLWRGLAQ